MLDYPELKNTPVVYKQKTAGAANSLQILHTNYTNADDISSLMRTTLKQAPFFFFLGKKKKI